MPTMPAARATISQVLSTPRSWNAWYPPSEARTWIMEGVPFLLLQSADQRGADRPRIETSRGKPGAQRGATRYWAEGTIATRPLPRQGTRPRGGVPRPSSADAGPRHELVVGVQD